MAIIFCSNIIIINDSTTVIIVNYRPINERHLVSSVSRIFRRLQTYTTFNLEHQRKIRTSNFSGCAPSERVNL